MIDLDLDLGVDVMGDITHASGSIAPTTRDRSYAYDPLYRLTTAQTGATPPTPLELYTYGKTGDRTSASLNGAAAQTYTYTAGTHRFASVAGAARTYDLNGNTQTGIGSATLSYDDRNRLSTAVVGTTNAVYLINGRGERVSKATSVGGSWSVAPTLYTYDESGQLLGDYTGATPQAEYIYLDGTPIAVAKSGTLSYIETDHLGTPRQVVNPATNTALWTWDLLASTFGTAGPNQSPGGGAAYTLNLRFPGQYYDAETGLNYNYFRDYEPTTGRYVESDPVGLIGGPSTYAFESSSPLVWSDPLGLAPRKLDPNGEECKALARKIQNIRDNIKKRITAISFNPNDLPLIALGAPNRDSVYGHQKIVDELNDILQKRLQEYEEKCGCGGGSCPNGGGAPAPSFSPSPGGLSTPSKIGIGLGACVIAVCVLQPELCVPAVIIAG